MVKVKCEFCGAEYDDPDSIFCEKCGHKMERKMQEPGEGDTDYVRCNYCGWKNQKGARVCVNCGERIYQRTI
jgi:DNA-directed RNA polymerase subunit RPC12/RpoP